MIRTDLIEAFAGHDGVNCNWAIVSKDGTFSAVCTKPKGHDGPHGNDEHEWSAQ